MFVKKIKGCFIFILFALNSYSMAYDFEKKIYFSPKESYLSTLDAKMEFDFRNEPIDVVIPCVEKDVEILELCIESVKKYCANISRIIVVSSKKLTDKAEWIDENQFPFTKEDVALAMTGSKEAAKEYLEKKNSRFGWFFQQILKMYAPFVVSEISSNVLIVDADVVFLRPVCFQDKNGAPFFNVSAEYHFPYFAHMERILPGLGRVFPDYSGISHHMLFQKSILEELFFSVEELHGEEFWKVFCSAIDSNELEKSGASEYEIYFNFALKKCPDARIRLLKTGSINDLINLENYIDQEYDYVACHSYQRSCKKL